MSVSSTASARFTQRDVKLLVDMVRLSRVTLLVAEAGADKSGFLRTAVLPLLNEKKRGSAGGEIAVLFDEWDKAPLPALNARIRQCVGSAGVAVAPPGAGSLIENLETWQEAMSETFLIVLDRFEDFLRAPREAGKTAEFEAAFVHIANDPTLRVNFLLALEQQAEPLLVNLRRHIPRLGYSTIRLPGASRDAGPAADRDTELQRATHAAPGARREEAQAVARAEISPAASLHVRPVTRTLAAPSRPPEAPQAAPTTEPAAPTTEPAAATTEPAAATTEPAADTTPPARGVTEGTAELAQHRPQGEDRPEETAQQPAAITVPPKRRFSRFAWVPALLIAGGIVYVLWQPELDEMVRRIAALRTEIPTFKPAPTEVAPEQPTKPSPAGVAVPIPERPQPPAEAATPKPISPARTEVAESKRESAAPKVPAAMSAAPAAEPRERSKPKAAGPNVAAASAASAPPADARELRKPEPVAAKPPEPATRPQAPAREPVVAAAPATSAATAPATAPAQATASEAVSGPVLRIHVRSEAQRAWAKQLVGPLKQRGIHVASIRVVPAQADSAHIRYYRATERTEAMRVAAALGELGVSARQLKHMDEMANSVPPRQYEVWLPVDGSR